MPLGGNPNVHVDTFQSELACALRYLLYLNKTLIWDFVFLSCLELASMYVCMHVGIYVCMYYVIQIIILHLPQNFFAKYFSLNFTWLSERLALITSMYYYFYTLM